MKKILITGSHGFLARHTAYLLKKKHYKIHGIGNGKWTKKQYKKWGYNYLINGKVNLNNLLKYFNKFDYVVHCAGSGTVGLSSQEDFKKNIIPIKSVLKFVKLKSPNSKIIFLSSYSVYGNNYINPIKENFKTKPTSQYAINKKIAEDLCLYYSKKYKINILIVRAASLYGDGLEKQLIFDACFKISNRNYNFFGTGKEIRDFIHISDMTNFIYFSVKRGFKGTNIINCGSGVGQKINKVLKLIISEFNLKIKPIFNKEGVDKNPKILISDIDMLNKLGFFPKKEFKNGIKEYVKWFKKNYL